MKVKAKWSVKDGNGWHDAGEIFETERDLGSAVEVLEGERQVGMEEVDTPNRPCVQQPETPKTARSSRRKK